MVNPVKTVRKIRACDGEAAAQLLLEKIIAEKIDRLWFLIKNMEGYDLEWEWMSKGDCGSDYLDRGEVLSIIEKVKSGE